MNPGVYGTWATRIVVASVDCAPCKQHKRGRSLKREPTRAYHVQIKPVWFSCVPAGAE
jgi:hypothetical protein